MSENMHERVIRLEAELTAVKGKLNGELANWCRTQKSKLFVTPETKEELIDMCIDATPVATIALTMNYTLEQIAEQVDKGI